MMKIDEQTIFHYVETVHFGRDGLSPSECKRVETYLQENADARQRVEEMRQHLALLKKQSRAVVPNGLALRCLQAAKQKSPFVPIYRWKFAPTAVVAILAIFITGFWLGGGFHNQPTMNESFLALSEEQNQLMQRLDTLLQDRAQSASDVLHPWEYPLAKLKASNIALQTAYVQYQGDPVVVRGLSVAVAQNIQVLQALCDYLESHGEVSDLDVQWLDSHSEPRSI